MDKELDVGRVPRTRRNNNIAILLLAFGGPDSIDSVKPFLQSVLAPRAVTDEQLQRATERYKAIGGKSPLLDITKRQATALEKILNEKTTPHLTSPCLSGRQALMGEGSTIKVYVGMRHWHPFIKDTLAQMAKDGIKKVIAIIMAPHNSKASTGGYVTATKAALEELSNAPQVHFAQNWHDRSEFSQLLADRIGQKLTEFNEPNKVHVIFSAHSLPLKVVENDPYVEQLNQTVTEVLKITGPLNRTLAYQSKGSGPLEWLGPDVEAVLEELAEKIKEPWAVSRETAQGVLLVPLSFVSDHVETLYDIDIAFKEKADKLGLNFKRTPSFNDSADFIKFLAKLVSEKLNGEGQ